MPRASRKTKPGASQFLLNGLKGIVVYVLLYLLLMFILAIPVALAIQYNLAGQTELQSLLEVASLVPLSVAAFLYLFLYKGYGRDAVLRALGLSVGGAFSLPKLVAIGLLLSIAIMAFEFFVGLLSTATNTPVNTNIGILLSGAPLWFLLFIAVIEPINEEILFRGLMVPRFGIVASAIIFGLGHASYDSTFGIEVIAAVIFGLLAGYAYKRTGSLYPSIIAHIIINTLAVIGFISGA